MTPTMTKCQYAGTNKDGDHETISLHKNGHQLTIFSKIVNCFGEWPQIHTQTCLNEEFAEESLRDLTDQLKQKGYTEVPSECWNQTQTPPEDQ